MRKSFQWGVQEDAQYLLEMATSRPVHKQQQLQKGQANRVTCAQVHIRAMVAVVALMSSCSEKQTQKQGSLVRSTFLESKVLTSEGDNFPLKLTLQKKGDSSIRNRVPWQISSNRKCRRSNQRELQTSHLQMDCCGRCLCMCTVHINQVHT